MHDAPRPRVLYVEDDAAIAAMTTAPAVHAAARRRDGRRVTAG